MQTYVKWPIFGSFLLPLGLAFVGLPVLFGPSRLHCHMQIDVRSEHDLDRYDQVFDNPELNVLFGVANGCALFLQFCDISDIGVINVTCFAVFLEVRDFNTLQEELAHPHRVPDPPIAWASPPPAEAAGGNNS